MLWFELRVQVRIPSALHIQRGFTLLFCFSSFSASSAFCCNVLSNFTLVTSIGAILCPSIMSGPNTSTVWIPPYVRMLTRKWSIAGSGILCLSVAGDVWMSGLADSEKFSDDSAELRVSAGALPHSHCTLPTYPPRATVHVGSYGSYSGFIMQFTYNSLNLGGDLRRRTFSQVTQSFPRPKPESRLGVRYSQHLLQVFLSIFYLTLLRRG